MNAKEWAIIVRQHSPLVWRTGYRLLGNEADAADCFQETFAGAWSVARREAVKNWGGMLQRLATARALDQLRRRQRDAKRIDSAVDVAEMRSAGNEPVEQVLAGELSRQLRSALAELPEQQSEAYCLRHLNGMSYQEIADELKISVSAVGVNLHRAGEKLRAILSPMFEGRERGEV
jgi:RNA polymerase sigma-70 factor (ECF subfamily)